MAIQYYAASSLDGFIADDQHSVAWLEEVEQPTVPTYERFMKKVGALLMGAESYEFILKHMAAGNPWPYTQPAWVFTHRDYPPQANVTFVSGAPREHFATIKAAAGDQNIWIVGGGDLAGQFYDAGLLDELIISIASIALASGKPVFPRRATLSLTNVEQMGSGFVELRFSCAQPA